MKTRVLLVDDHEVVRSGLRKVLRARPDLEVVAEAGDGWEAVDAARRELPDLIVMDLTLPRLSGILATSEILRFLPGAKILMLSMHEEASLMEEALRAGVSGYVLKSAAAADLLKAIDTVQQGNRYLSPSLAETVIDRMIEGDASPPSPLASLTPREREILRRVAEGLSAREIAADLRLSARTVETHRNNLMRKLGVRKTSGLVRIAIRERLVDA